MIFFALQPPTVPSISHKLHGNLQGNSRKISKTFLPRDRKIGLQQVLRRQLFHLPFSLARKAHSEPGVAPKEKYRNCYIIVERGCLTMLVKIEVNTRRKLVLWDQIENNHSSTLDLEYPKVG